MRLGASLWDQVKADTETKISTLTALAKANPNVPVLQLAQQYDTAHGTSLYQVAGTVTTQLQQEKVADALVKDIKSSSGIPWGTILLVCAGLYVVSRLFKKRATS